MSTRQMMRQYVRRDVVFLLVLSSAFVTVSSLSARYRRSGATDDYDPTAYFDGRVRGEDSLNLLRSEEVVLEGTILSAPPLAPSRGSEPGETTDEDTGAEKREEKNLEYLRQVNIEKFKQTILKRLHLTAPPDLSQGGRISNRTIANELLRSLPLALQNRLLNQFRAADGVVEPAPDRTDEKETLILLHHLQWILPMVSSATFAVELADEIDPSRIQSATLFFETSEPALKGQHLEVWEVFLKAPRSGKPERNDHLEMPTWPRYRNLTSLFEEKRSNVGYTTLPAPSVIRRNGHRAAPSPPPLAETIQIRPGRIAEAVVPNLPGRVQVNLDISSSLAQWMSHKRRQPLLRKVVRSILVICPKCDSHVEPVDVRKGILEIRHHNALRRTRRSADAGMGAALTIGNQCSSKGHKFSCCTQPFSLNFEDVGWNNWILHPKKVEPNYCHGSCQAEGIQKTPHSDLMHIYRSQNYGQLSEVQREAMLSCCHPTKMASMSVLYVDPNNELRMNTLHNIIVLECSCS